MTRTIEFGVEFDSEDQISFIGVAHTMGLSISTVVSQSLGGGENEVGGPRFRVEIHQKEFTRKD